MNKSTDIKIGFEFKNLKFLELIEEDWQVIARIESEFCILINDKILYKDIYFNLAEFAISISEWLNEVTDKDEDYYFETIDSDEVGLVWLKKKNNNWKIGSIHQEYEETYLFDLAGIDNAVRRFLNKLLSNLPENVKKRVEKML